MGLGLVCAFARLHIENVMLCGQPRRRNIGRGGWAGAFCLLVLILIGLAQVSGSAQAFPDGRITVSESGLMAPPSWDPAADVSAADMPKHAHCDCCQTILCENDEALAQLSKDIPHITIARPLTFPAPDRQFEPPRA